MIKHTTLVIIIVLLVQLLLSLKTFAHHGGEGITSAGLSSPTTGITGTNVAGPIITIPASTLPKGLKFINFLTDYTNFETFSERKLRQLQESHGHAHNTQNLFVPSVGLGYGLTDNLTLATRIPYVFRYDVRNVHEGDVAKRGNSIGVGDITFFGQYRFLKSDKYRLQSALLTGLKIPSGVRRAKGRDGKLFEVDEQPGSGSWDPFVGLAVSKQIGKVSLDANGLYKFATRGSRDSDLGDVVNYNVALSHRLLQNGILSFREKRFLNDKYSFDVIFEMNGSWSQDPNTLRGFVDKKHGSTLIFLSPGLRFAYDKKWIWNISAGLPIIHDASSNQRSPNIKLVTGITRAF